MATIVTFLSAGKTKYSLAGVLLLLFTVQADAARTVEAKRECATCHIMWIDEFKRKDITPLIPYDPRPVTKTGKQDATSSERMCFSCHDGFVLDSRFMWNKKTHGHPVGVKPPKGMKIPTSEGKTIFPLNDEGKIYCGTCHTAHGVDWSSEDSPIFMRVKNIDSSLCLACHLDKSTGPKEGNHPIFKKPPHNPDGMIEAGAKFSNDGSVICQSCHRPHGGKQKAILVKNNSNAGLCYSCHKDKRGVVGSKHDMAVMAPEVKNIHGDDVTKEGPCSACHVPHGGKGSALWARTIPVNEKDKTAGMCTTCHNKEGIAKDKLTGLHTHPVNLTLDKLDIQPHKKHWSSKHALAQGKQAPESLPLFDKNGQRTNKEGRISCPTCHDPHNWSVLVDAKKVTDPENTKESPKNTEGDGNSSFLRIRQGEDSKLCLNCHVDKRTLKQTSHNISLTNKDNNPKSTNKKDSCGYCHAVHNAKGITLRSRDKGAGNMSIETWCKDCHKKEGLAKDKLIAEHSHPLGEHPENFSVKSGLPLFDKEGKRVDHNGLVDCATCHNPHQWAPDKIVSNNEQPDKKEGDAGNSFLRIKASGNSVLCASCHQKNALVTGTDHDMSVTAKNTKNALGQTPEQSGLCGQCHAVHNSILKNNLWALKAGKGSDINEQSCRSCHSKDGKAKAKVPPSLRHPKDVLAWSSEIRKLVIKNKLPDIRVFDKEGKAAQSGVISCPSCHNPHQWDPRKAKPGEGKNVEGDALTSFLRNSNSEHIVCADCHGQDSLFRYKYFHGKTSRKKYPLYR